MVSKALPSHGDVGERAGAYENATGPSYGLSFFNKHLVPADLHLVSRVRIKLILTVLVTFFVAFVEEEYFWGSYSSIFTGYIEV